MSLKTRIQKLEEKADLDDDKTILLTWDSTPGELIELSYGNNKWRRSSEESNDDFMRRIKKDGDGRSAAFWWEELSEGSIEAKGSMEMMNLPHEEMLELLD